MMLKLVILAAILGIQLQIQVSNKLTNQIT